MATSTDDPGPSGVPQDPAVTTPVTVVSTPEAGQDWFGPQGDLRNLQEGLAAFDEQLREGRQTPDRRRRLEQPPGLTGQAGPPPQGGHLMDAEELRQSLQSITGILQGLTARVQGLEGAQQSSTAQMQQGLVTVDQRLQLVEQARAAGVPTAGTPHGPGEIVEKKT